MACRSPGSVSPGWTTGLRAAATVAYPFLIYAGMGFVEPRWLALGLLAIWLLRAGWLRPSKPGGGLAGVLAPFAAVACVLAFGAWSNDARFLLFVPVLVSVALLFTFARTLGSGASMIERFARLKVPDLPGDEAAYCRNVTRVWCGFFAANGIAALWLALAGSLAAWTLYTGFVAYLLIGALFAGELVYRSWRFRRYRGAFTDPLLRRVFPPRSPA